MYLHTPAVEAGSWWRVDTASGSDTGTTVYAHDGTDPIPNYYVLTGSTVRNTTRDGTAQFWSATQTLYMKELTYQGAPNGTVVTSTGVTPAAPVGGAPVDIAAISTAVAALPTTYVQLLVTDATSTTLTGTLAAGHLSPVDCTVGPGVRTLPAANSVAIGTPTVAKKADTTTNTLTVQRAGSDLIFGTGAGATSKTLTLSGEAVTFVSNGVDRWSVESSDTPSAAIAAGYAPIAATPVASSATSGTLTAGAEHNLSPTSAAAWTLPTGVAATKLPTTVKNNGTAAVTVARGGSDTINGGTTSVSIAATEWARFTSDGAGAWTQSGTAGQSGTYAPNAITGTWAASTSYAIGSKVANSGRYWVRTATPSGSETTFDYTKWAYAGRIAGGWGTSIVLLGNSRVYLETFFAGTTSSLQQRGFFNWANVYMGQKFTVLNYAGVSGDTLVQMAARWGTAVGAYAPENVLIADFINDRAAGVATIKTRYQTLIDLNRTIGARTILLTATPKDSMSSADKATWSQVNRWLTTLTDPDIVVVDVASAVCSTTAIAWATNYGTDGQHQSRQGAARIGKAIADALGPLAPPSSLLPSGVLDASASPVSNPFMDSTSAVSGVPTGWGVFPTAGGAVTYSLVARTDGKQGNWFQMDTASTTTDTFASSTASLSGFATAGTDRAYGVAEIQADTSASPSGQGFRVYLQFLDVSNAVVATTTCLDYQSASQVGDSGDSTAYLIGSLPGVSATAVFATAPVLIPSTATQAKLLVEYNAQGKVRIGRHAVYKV